ncbi:T9SS type A sorting domain-containing protein [Bacteroidota bacterium]
MLRTNNGSVTFIKEEQINELHTNYTLFQNYPNPFNTTTKINWQSPVSSWQTMKVYDMLGNEVAILINEYKLAGSYEVEFNVNKLSSGVYFYQLTAGNFIE